VSYLEKMEGDMARNGYYIPHKENLTTFIYMMVGQKKQMINNP